MHVCFYFNTVSAVLSCFSRVACQASLSMGFSRQEYWSGLPCPPPGDLPDPDIEFVSLISPALAGRFFTISATWKLLFSAEKQSADYMTLTMLVSSQPP